MMQGSTGLVGKIILTGEKDPMKEEAQKKFIESGLTPDRYGNFIIEDKSKYRFKLQDNSFRIEKFWPEIKIWHNVLSGRVLYYSKYTEKIPLLIKKVQELSKE